MKRIILAAAILTLGALAYSAGRTAGIRHAIHDSTVYTVDIYDPDDPAASAWNGYDQLIYIDLDGETYTHGMYQS